jgi:Tol biopolymer transport system component
MSKLITCIFLLTFTVSDIHGQTQTRQTGGASGKQSVPTSFTEKLLKFFGISDSPSTLKGPGDEITSGELWLGDLDSKTTRALTSGAGYRSPVFLSGTKDVLALRGTDVMQVSSAGGEGKKLCSVDAIIKLVGSGSEDPGKVLILLRGEAGGHPRVALLTVNTGAVTVVPYDPASSQDLQMVENLQGWSRTYGDQHVYVKRQAKQALSGTVEWSDAFLKVGNQEEVDVSRCDGAQCGQPSLSENGRLLVFVKAKAE